MPPTGRVCVHGSRVTLVQQRTRCGSTEAAPAAIGPEATCASHYPLSYPLRSKEARDKKPGLTGLTDSKRGKGDRRQLHFPSCCLTRNCYQGSPPLGGDAMPSFIRECIRSGEASQPLIRTIPLLRCHRPLCTNDGRFFTP